MAKARHTYRFRSVWQLPAPPSEVFAVLARAEEYPSWWPQIREVTSLDAETGTVRIRSFLPYDLHLTARTERSDPQAGVLQTTLTGDLHGWARWTLLPAGEGTRALFEQCVEVRKPLMRLLSVPGRPLFRANHTHMMRAGRRGLRARLLAQAEPGGPRRGLDEG